MFERVGHVLVGGAAQRVEEFVTVILGRVVRGGDHNPGRQVFAARGPGDGGRGGVAARQKNRDAVGGENIGGGARELGAQKTRVITDGHAVCDFVFLVFEEVGRQRGRERAHVGKGVIFGDFGAPAVGSKTNIGGHEKFCLGLISGHSRFKSAEDRRAFRGWYKGNRAARNFGPAAPAKARLQTESPGRSRPNCAEFWRPLRRG